MSTTPLSRRSDPATSRQGALFASKRLGSMQRAVLLAMVDRHGWTASELEDAEGVRTRTYGRRMNELAAKGYVKIGEARACKVTGRSALTYSLTAAGVREVGA